MKDVAERKTCVCVCVCVCVYQCFKNVISPIIATSQLVINTATAKSLESCPTVCDPMDPLLGSSVHEILQARIPWVEEPGGLQSMWLQTVGHD